MFTGIKNKANSILKRNTEFTNHKSDEGSVDDDESILKFMALPNGMLGFVERYAYEMFAVHIDQMCEKIISRGFSYNNVEDPLKTSSTESLADLQNIMSNTACQSLINKDTFVYSKDFLTISEIIRRKYLGDASGIDKMTAYRRSNEYSIRDNRRYYAFYFGNNSGGFPIDRETLVGIVEVTEQEVSTLSGGMETVYQASITDYQDTTKVVVITFDKKLVFSMPYAQYLNVFLLGFENLIMLLVNSKKILSSDDYKIFQDEGGFLDKDITDYQEFKDRIQPFVDGDTNSIVLGKGLGLNITKGESGQEITNVNVDFAKEIMSFLTNRPKSILFGEAASGLNASKEEDKMLEEEFLTSKARADFLPILHTFCDIWELKGRENLDFISYFDSMRLINLTKEFDEDIVDDNIKYKIREAYYKMLNMKGTPPPIEHIDNDGNDDDKKDENVDSSE